MAAARSEAVPVFFLCDGNHLFAKCMENFPPSFSFMYDVYFHQEFKKCTTVDFINLFLSASGFCIHKVAQILPRVALFVLR